MKFSDLQNSPNWPKCARCHNRPMAFAVSESEMDNNLTRMQVSQLGLKALRDIGVNIPKEDEDKVERQILQAGIHIIRLSEGDALADEIENILSYLAPAPPPWCDECLQAIDWSEYYLQQLKDAYDRGERQS